VAVLQLAPNGKASLVPIAILVGGKFWDATAYKADPIPMALEPGTLAHERRATQPAPRLPPARARPTTHDLPRRGVLYIPGSNRRALSKARALPAVALFCVFPVLINTQQGVRNVDRSLLEVARAFNTSERRLWTDVIIPSSLPFMLAGVRLSLGRGLIGMIVAEFFIGLVGLGYLIIQYGNVFRIDRMFVPVITVATLGIVFMGLVQWIESRVAPWLRREQ